MGYCTRSILNSSFLKFLQFSILEQFLVFLLFLSVSCFSVFSFASFSFYLLVFYSLFDNVFWFWLLLACWLYLSVCLSIWPCATLLVPAVIHNRTNCRRREEGNGEEESAKRGFEEICFSQTKGEFRFQSDTCSFISELRSSREEQQNCHGGGGGARGSASFCVVMSLKRRVYAARIISLPFTIG